MPTFRFDDVDAMNAAASEEFGEWGPEMAITQEMINAFADLTGDHQWIHVDVERALARALSVGRSPTGSSPSACFRA